MSTIQWTATERNGRPRRSTLAIVAVLAGVVCGAATISAAMTRPGDDRRPADAPAGCRHRTTEPRRGSGREPRRRPFRRRRRCHPRILAGGPIAAPPPTPPAGSAGSLEPDLVLLGSWTVEYVVGPANGNGANIAIPLDGSTAASSSRERRSSSGQAIGEVSRRTGYRRGAIIAGHRIDPDGALAGGICTVSTALFNAAARAGLQITARTSHSGYLAKYPLGLDAAVAKGDGFRQIDGIPQRHDGADRHPHRQHAGHRARRPVRAERARSDRRVQPAGGQRPSEGT